MSLNGRLVLVTFFAKISKSCFWYNSFKRWLKFWLDIPVLNWEICICQTLENHNSSLGIKIYVIWEDHQMFTWFESEVRDQNLQKT